VGHPVYTVSLLAKTEHQQQTIYTTIYQVIK